MAEVTLVIQNKTVPKLTVKPQAVNTWGLIGGTLANQTDLWTELAGKAALNHTHTFAQITSKPTTLAGYGITDAENVANKGLANGYVPLDGTGKIDPSYLPQSVLGATVYQGVWNANTNSPTLASGVGTKGHYYIVNVPGATSIDGVNDWKLGDWIIFDGTTWSKVDNTDAVLSVNGQTGAVALTGTAGRITISGSNVFDVGSDVAISSWNLGQFAQTTSAQLAGIISDKTGTGSLVFGTNPTLDNPAINRISLAGNISASAWTTNGVGLVEAGRTITDTTSSGTVPNAYTHVLGGNLIAATNTTTYSTYSALVVTAPSQSTNVTITRRLAARFISGTYQMSFGDISGYGSTIWTLPTSTAITVANWAISGDSSDTRLNAPSTAGNVYLLNAGAINVQIARTSQIFTPSVATSGAITSWTFTKPSNTNQTASSNIPGWLLTTGSRQWLNGAIALQEEVRITAPVYSHVSGSNTITTAATLSVYAPTTSGGFTTITNPYAIMSNGGVYVAEGTASVRIGNQVGSTARGAVYINQSSPNTTNFALSAHQTSNQTYINGAGGVAFLFNGGIQWILSDKLSTIGQGLTNYDFAFTSTNGTKLGTASTDKIGFWNATPIVQPTTAVAAATIVNGVGTASKQDDTFDGYTVAKVVKALRNIGLLA